MQKILKKIFFSTKITSLLFLLFAISMAIATFLEQKYSTEFAKIFVYESTWFEIIMLLIIINLIGNIWKYKLWSYRKIPILIFHLSFVFIFIGGIFSRYYSFEGIMPLREGETSKKIISSKNYIKLKVFQRNNTKFYNYPYNLSSYNKKYKKTLLFNNNPLKINIIDYIPCAKIFLSKKKTGEKILKIISNDQKGRTEHFIEDKNITKINGVIFSLNKKIPYGIQIFEKKNKLYFKSSYSGDHFDMINKKTYLISKNTINTLKIKNLYRMKTSSGMIQWVIPNEIVTGKLEYIQSCEKEEKNNNNSLNAITAKITFLNESKLVTFLGGANTINMSDSLQFRDYKISIGYGSIFLYLPFYLRLDNFKLENYPGSEFPSSFMSYITIIDKKKIKNYLIYMNNVLNYKGYRFFQSGYDSDKKGTRLSVNNDYLGTYFSYTGYFLMSVGMLITLFWKGTRFNYLINKLKNLTIKNYSIIIFLFLLLVLGGNDYSFFFAKANNSIITTHKSTKIPLENVSDCIYIPKKHSENFGRLLVQDYKGRIKPINTMAIELLRKIHKKNSIGDIDANQWFISIHQDNIFWTRIPFIRVNKKGGYKFLKKVKANQNYCVSLMDLYFLDPKTSTIKYLLKEDYETAFSKNPMQRNEYDKAVLSLSERVGIIHEIFRGKYIRIFPIPNDVKKTWSSWIISDSDKLNLFGFSMYNNYLKSLLYAQNEKDWSIADNEIEKIRSYQIKYSKSILPSNKKISIEIIYNKLNIFYILSFLYAIFGIIIIINFFLVIFFQKKYLLFFSKVFFIISLFLHILNFIGLIFRWYISGHAPWTNGYESAVFISFCLVGIGFLFYKNRFVLGINLLIASILLIIAHGNIMDPEITNLVPVLKSHWLIIHVAIITSSYGFFFTGSFLGFFVLLLYILKAYVKSYKRKIQNHIEKLTIINEMCLIIGLFLLTIGTFLGSVWANNSWGRYWSWDPKETWALVSIMIYAFLLHIRLIPNMRNILTFNFFSILSISSIIMTYFGVNYYLSGLHSYAKGDPISIPCWIYYSLLILFFVASFAYYFDYSERNHRLKKYIIKK
ncbi:cytochrome c biogenesis protein [Blattabacterium cuenoti]|uniref:cytochrome c biogenesis protein n=1 Tax=Blattabacterium cuenoti TaxID=1653831 RepID=UPI00163C950A|nr:cytochrome c biogenesis protein CcsA [Blattabacterium cuenoti]